MRLGALGFCGTIAALLLFGARSLAGDPITAEALFKAGREAAARGDHAAACPKFAESHRLDPAPGTLLNLGECREKLGQLASAWQAYQEAADRLRGDPRSDMLVLARRRLAAIEPRLSRLTIELAPGAPAQTTITRDDVEIGRAGLGVPVPVDPGEHSIVVTAPGREAKRFDVRLVEAQSEKLVVEPGPPWRSPPAAALEPKPVASRRVDKEPSGTARAIGFAAGGVGLASLAAGIVTGVMTLDRKKAMEANCHDQLCNPSGVTAATQGRTLSIVSTATFIAAGVGLGAGTYLVVANWPRTASTVRLTAGPFAAGLQFTEPF